MRQCDAAQDYLARQISANTNLVETVLGAGKDTDRTLAQNSGELTNSPELFEFIIAVKRLLGPRLAELDTLIDQHISPPELREKWAQTFNLLGPSALKSPG